MVQTDCGSFILEKKVFKMLHIDLITVCFLHDCKKPQMAVSPDEEVEEEKNFAEQI